ncbi:MAG: ATP-binding protein [Sphingobacteriaceae bacterium]|nr:ATP-binding protein [Sphingobacteriaceae bacterium]
MSYPKASWVVVLLLLFGCQQNSPTSELASQPIIDSAFAKSAVYIDQDQTSLVTPYLDSIYHVWNPLPIPQLLRKYHFLGNMHLYATKDYEAAAKYLDSSKTLLKAHPDYPHDLLRYYFLKGNYHLEKNEFELALRSLFKGKTLIDSLNITCEGRGIANTLGYLLYKQERYTEALYFFKERAAINQQCKIRNSVQHIFNKQQDHNEIGLCYEKIGQYDSALYHYNQGIALLLNYQQTHTDGARYAKSLGVLLGNKGSCYAQMLQFDSAKFYLQRSIDMNLKPRGEWGDALLCKIKLGHVYLQTKEGEQAALLISEIQQELLQQPELLIAQRLAALQRAYAEHIGDYKQALFFAEINQQLLDSIRFQGPNKFGQPDFKASFNALEQEINLVKLRNASERKTFYFLLILIALGSSLAFGFIILNKRKREKRYTQELEKLHQNAQALNQQLIQGLEDLEQSHAENTRLMKVLVHDLRSPMAGILSAIQLLQHEKLSQKDQQEFQHLIEKSAENALHFIKDLLHISTVDKTENYTQQDLDRILKSCLQLAKLEADKKGQSLQAQLISVNVPIHQQKIWRVFNNLLTNAIKFSQKGAEIFIEMHEEATSVTVVVRDTGLGIAAEQQKNLFAAFSVTGQTGTAGEKSYGMGLAISKQIITAHQGEIWLESSVGKGSAFYVRLPKQRK